MRPILRRLGSYDEHFANVRREAYEYHPPHGWGVVAVAICAGTTRKDRPCTMPAAGVSDYCYLHDPDPAVAARCRRNASRAASIGNSKIDGEIRDVRLMAKELVEQTVSGELDLRVKRRLTEITQLIQSYCRLAELELATGGRPRFSQPGEYGLAGGHTG